ncbi:putative tonB-dependent receptor [Pseudomonas aeruginosa]|nr:putative tonB-dependent receptor [Pseudomonas aeruginosa]RCG88891.1 putative tonB-dependent receptor [Pseudomonas aeruginosa]
MILHRECPQFRHSRTQAAGGHAAQGSDLAKGSKGGAADGSAPGDCQGRQPPATRKGIRNGGGGAAKARWTMFSSWGLSMLITKSHIFLICSLLTE